MDKIASKPIQRFKKGDSFIKTDPHSPVFMEINEVEEMRGNMDFCIVSWYMLDGKGLHTQRRFPMVALDGKFSDFEPIPRRLLKEAKRLMRQYNADVKQLTDKEEAKSLYNEYNHELFELLSDAKGKLGLAEQIESCLRQRK